MSYQIAHNPAFSPPTAEPKLAFLSSFYQTSDTESKHDEYVSDFFTPDATLIMGSKTAVGSDEIRTLRHGLWTHVLRRKHSPKTVAFVNENELLLYGVVRYELRSAEGNEVEVPWAGRVVFATADESRGGLKMKFYQVYLDPSAQSGRK